MISKQSISTFLTKMEFFLQKNLVVELIFHFQRSKLANNGFFARKWVLMADIGEKRLLWLSSNFQAGINAIESGNHMESLKFVKLVLFWTQRVKIRRLSIIELVLPRARIGMSFAKKWEFMSKRQFWTPLALRQY